MNRIRRGAAATVVGVVAFGGFFALQAGTSDAGALVATAQLRNQAGATVGTVEFRARGGSIVGTVDVTIPTDGPEFRGFHIHANDVDNNPIDGNSNDGCIGDFTSVDGHWDAGGHTHGSHLGDLPVLMRDPNGRARTTFVIGKFTAADIVNRAVIVHAVPDNYANIPTRYTSPSQPAGGPDPITLGNGDGGARYAGGVITAAP